MLHSSYHVLYEANLTANLLILGACNFNVQMMNQALTVQSVVLRMEIIWNARWYAWAVEKYTNLDLS